MGGRITPQAYERLANWSEQYFQPGLRLLLPLLLVLLIPDAIDTEDKLLVLGAALVLFGLAGRLGALIVIVSLGWHYPHDSNPVVSYGLIFATSWILLLGTGRYSLWQWGDDWFQRYDGA